MAEYNKTKARWINFKTSAIQRRFIEIIDGLLLGDGCVSSRGTLLVGQENSRIGWLHQISEQLDAVGCVSSIRSKKFTGWGRIGRERIKNNPASYMTTPSYGELKAQRVRWYPNGRKRIPRDLRLTPLVLGHWFAGDGTGARGLLRLCTNGFLKKDVVFLIDRLRRDLGITASPIKVRSGQFVISIHRLDEAHRMAGVLRDVLPACCLYKIEDTRPRLSDGALKALAQLRLEVLSKSDVAVIRKRVLAGETQRQLAAEFGVSSGVLSGAVRGKTYSHVPGAVPSTVSAKLGTRARRAAQSKLTWKQAQVIRARVGRGDSQKSLATEYGVSPATISGIVRRRFYATKATSPG